MSQLVGAFSSLQGSRTVSLEEPKMKVSDKEVIVVLGKMFQ